MPLCNVCGKQNREQARFCGYCGRPLQGSPSQPAQETRKAPQAASSARWLKQVPGFRSGQRWKQIVAAAGYTFIALAIGAGAATNDVALLLLGVDALAIVLLVTNAWGLRSRVPLFNSSRRLKAASGWGILLVVGFGALGVVVTATSKAPPTTRDAIGAGDVLAALERGIQRYLVPSHGVLELAVPLAWQDKAKYVQTEAGGTLTIEFASARGARFTTLLSVVWNASSFPPGYNAGERVRALVQQFRDKTAPTAVETEIALQSIRGTAGEGFFFSVTDKAPTPTGFKYATQGSLGVGGLLLGFTILSDEKEGEAVQAGLTLLRGVRHRQPDEVALRQSYEIQLPAQEWDVVLDIPGYIVLVEEMRPDQQGRMMRAANEQTGMILSLFLERERQSMSAQACRDHYWTKTLQSPLPKTAIRSWDTDTMALGEYMVEWMTGQRVMQKNVNAYMGVGTVCVDLHLSKVQYTDQDESLFSSVLKGVRIKSTTEDGGTQKRGRR